MKGWGIALAIIGIIVAGLALGMDTTASTGGSYLAPAEVYNLGKLQAQELTFIAGCALFVAGVAIASAGAVMDTTKRGVNYLQARRENVAVFDADIPAGYTPASAKPVRQPLTPEEKAELAAKATEEARATDRMTYWILCGLALAFLIIWGLAYASGKGGSRDTTSSDVNTAAVLNASPTNELQP